MITNYIKLAKQRLKKSLGFVIRLGKNYFLTLGINYLSVLLSLNFIRLLRVVFFSQQRMNRPAVNAVP